MSTLAIEREVVLAENVTITDDTLTVDLSDGRTISVPLGWYPRLSHGSPEERNIWRLVGRGKGVHWEKLDEDLSVEQLLAGIPSGESQSSLSRWLSKRGPRRKTTSSRKCNA